MIATMLGVVDPGDEVIVFEPYYENYGPDAILSGATPRFVPLREPDWSFDPEELAAAFSNSRPARSSSTRRTIPPARCSRARSSRSSRASVSSGTSIAITDEIYDHILYDGAVHVPLATLDGMAERTVTINSLSKTFSVTGWRVGWAISPPALAGGIRKVHDFLTVGAPAPMQEAGAFALGMDDSYYRGPVGALRGAPQPAARCADPQRLRVHQAVGRDYIMTDITGFGFRNDVEFVRHLVTEIGVAAVPGSSFYRDPSRGMQKVRFCFCKQ